MDIGMGAAILIIGMLATYLVALFIGPDFCIAFSVIFLAAVIAAKSTESKPTK